MRNINFAKLFEIFAVLPIFAICLACFYKYCFYNALNLSWINSQLQLSGILLNAIPIFYEIFIGSIMAFTIYITLKNVFDNIQLYLVQILILFLYMFISVFINWELSSLEVILSRSLFYYTLFFVSTILCAVENIGIIRNSLICLAIISLLFLQSLINFKSHEEVKKLFYQDESFSKVYFTEEGKKVIPTKFYSTVDGIDKEYELDWRLLELVGDKAIVIVSNRYELDGVKKPQVRIVDYKLIDRVY